MTNFFVFSLLSLFSIIYVSGILYLRFINTKVYTSFLSNELYINFLNISLVVIIIIFYALLLRNFIKLHLYYVSLAEDFYAKLTNFFRYNYNYRNIADTLWLKIALPISKLNSLMRKEFLGFSLRYDIAVLLKHIHYIVLVSLIFYDIIFNNMILSKVYYVFPYIYIYDIYIRLCDLYINTNFFPDITAHTFLYADPQYAIFISKDEIWINNEPYDVANVIGVYLRFGLNYDALAPFRGEPVNMKYNYFSELHQFRNLHRK